MFQCERLSCRLLTDDDFNLFYDLFSNEEIMTYIDAPLIRNMEDGVAQFREVLDRQTDCRKGKMYVASLEESKIPIGIMKYEVKTLSDHGGIVALEAYLLKEHWGKKYGSEMLEGLITHLFTTTGVHRICAEFQVDNNEADHMMKKMSMAYEGVQKEGRYKENSWHDLAKFAILRKEWIQTNEVIEFENVLIYG